MFDYRCDSKNVILFAACSSSVVLVAWLIHLLVKVQPDVEEGNLMPQANPLVNDKVCELGLPDPRIGVRKIIRFFTRSVEQERKAQEDLEKLVREIYQGELKYSQDMRQVDQLRMAFIDEQQAVNDKLHEKLRHLAPILKPTSDASLVCKPATLETSTETLEESQKQLQILKDEWNRYELPDLRMNRLSITDMAVYKKQLEDDVVSRQDLHERILELSARHLKLRAEQCEKARAAERESAELSSGEGARLEHQRTPRT